MTFYQELQLNQAGSKAMVKNAKNPREKLHHTCIYMFKIGITLLFCMAFVMAFGRIFGDGNSTVGVVVLLFLMVFRNADFGICMSHSLKVMAAIFFRIFHNICGSIYGHLFYKFFNRSVNCIPAE